jgi:DHA1 family bicyclomycin/chloramphenicol resistance-like MFS transporter
LASRFLPETLNKDLRQEREGVVALGRRFASVMKDRIYMGVVAVGILNSIGLFGYLSIMPFIYQNHFGLAGSEYGYFFVLNSASGYIGVQVIAKVSQRIQLKWVVVGIFACQIVFGVGLVLAALLEANLFVVQATIMLLVFFIGGSFAPLGTLALTRHGEEAGTAAALNMVLGSIGTTLAAPLFAQLGSSNTLGLGLMEITVFTLALIGMFTIVNVRKMPNL